MNQFVNSSQDVNVWIYVYRRETLRKTSNAWFITHQSETYAMNGTGGSDIDELEMGERSRTYHADACRLPRESLQRYDEMKKPDLFTNNQKSTQNPRENMSRMGSENIQVVNC
jgi:hypothetical protein